MRVVLQRVSAARVVVDGAVVGPVGNVILQVPSATAASDDHLNLNNKPLLLGGNATLTLDVAGLVLPPGTTTIAGLITNIGSYQANTRFGNVVLLDPSYHLGINAAGLLSADGQRFFLDSYAKVEPTIDARSPVPTVFVDYLKTVPSFPYHVDLVGINLGVLVLALDEGAELGRVNGFLALTGIGREQNVGLVEGLARRHHVAAVEPLQHDAREYEV